MYYDLRLASFKSGNIQIDVYPAYKKLGYFLQDVSRQKRVQFHPSEDGTFDMQDYKRVLEIDGTTDFSGFDECCSLFLSGLSDII